MKEIFWELFELIITLFECGVSMRFVCEFLGVNLNEKSNYKLWLGLLLCYAIAVSIMNRIIPYEGLLVFSYSIIVFIYAILLLPGSILKKAFVSVFFLCCIIMNSSLGVNLSSAILGADVNEIYAESGGSRLVTVVFVQLLNLLVFQSLTRLFGKGALKLRMHEWLLIAGTFFISILGMTLIQIVATHSEATKIERLCFLGTDMAIIIVDYITIRLVSILNRHHQTELENQHLRMQMQYQTQYADTVRQQEESVHRLRHDLKTTISAMYGFIYEGNIQEMEKYLSTYATSLAETASIVHTNQPFLNAILNTKMTYAKEQGIQCTCHSPELLPNIHGADYCSLLGNLLDNAIEAQLNLSRPEMSVIIDYTNSRLTISVKNRIQNSILTTNSKLYTTKSKTCDHGHGIPTIKEIVSRYQGTVDFYEDDGWFIANVVLYP